MSLPRVNAQSVTFTCIRCEEEKTVNIDGADYIYWRYNRQDLIQNVFPHLTADERELMISGICGKCYDELFKDDEDEE